MVRVEMKPSRWCWSGRPAQVGRVARRAGTLGAVVRHTDAREQERRQGLPEERGDLGVEEGHSRRADAERVRGQVQATLHDPRIELGLAVPAVVERVQVDGTATVVSLPEALDGLVDYYRSVAGEHPDWDDYRNAMQREQRVLVRIALERAGPTKSG